MAAVGFNCLFGGTEMDFIEQERKASILKGIAHPVRLSIVELLAEKDLCVKEIAERYPYDRTTISKHLAQLKKLDILEGHRDGLNIYYRLKMIYLPFVLQCMDNLTYGKNESDEFFSRFHATYERQLAKPRQQQ